MSPQAADPANLAASLQTGAEAAGWTGRAAFHDAGGTWSHGEVHAGGHRSAAALAGAGVGPGDRVLLAASDQVAAVWALLGAARLGATTVLVNPRLPEADHLFALADCQARLVVCDEALARRFDGRVPTVAVDRLAEARPGTWPAAGVVPGTECYAQYTSGTTGRPRAALHRHSDPACYFRAMKPVLTLRPDDVVYSASKAYFAYGLGNSVLFPLLAGCSAVLDPQKATIERVAAMVARHRATVLFAVPTVYAGLVSRSDRAGFDSVRLAVSAGEPLQPALYRRVREWLGCDVLDGLGTTEVGQTFVSNLPGRSRPGTVGRVLDGYEVSIRGPLGPGGPPLAAGEVGALWVRGASVMVGYLDREGETAATLVDGWCQTGDRAAVDDEGYVTLHGRLDDLEIVGGNNVSPLEVEAVLLEHPAICEVAVAGVVEESGASRLRCFAVLQPGERWSPALQEDLLAAARARLAAYKVPRSVTAVESLPRTPTGKLRRHLLRSGWPLETTS